MSHGWQRLMRASLAMAGFLGAIGLFGCGGGGASSPRLGSSAAGAPQSAPSGLVGTPARVDFGTVRAGDTYTRDISVVNSTSGRSIVVTGVRVDGSVFSAGAGPFPRTLPPGGSLPVRATYHA